MPEEREEILLFDVNNSPAKVLQPPIIKQQLVRDIGKKDEAALLMSTAMETINNYPTDWIHVYSDGSATDGTTNAGYGSLIQLPDGTSRELFDSCGKYVQIMRQKQLPLQKASTLSHQFLIKPQILGQIWLSFQMLSQSFKL